MKRPVVSVLYKLEMTTGNNIMELGSLISVEIMASLDGGDIWQCLTDRDQVGVITLISHKDLVLIRLLDAIGFYRGGQLITRSLRMK